MAERRLRGKRGGESTPGDPADWGRPAWVETWHEGKQAPARPRRRTYRRGARLRRLAQALGILLGLLLLLLAGLYLVEWRYRGRILPHVYVAGVDLGNLSPEEAEATLRLHHKDLEEQPLVLTYADRVWRPSGADLGLRIDWAGAVAEAMAVGRRGPLWQRAQERWQAWTAHHDLLLPAVLDEGALRAYLMGLAQQIDAPPQDASLAVEGRQVTIRPSREGRSLIVGRCMEQVRQALAQMSAGPLTLAVETVPPQIDEQAAQEALKTARRMLSGPLTLHLDERTWTLTPEQIGQMLTVQVRQESDHNTLAVLLDQEALRQFVEGIAAKVRVYPRNARFRFVEDHLEVTEEGVAGKELAVEAAMERINEAVLSEEREIELRITEVPPAIRRETLDELGIREVVGVGVSYFAGSAPYRVHNIVTAARLLDGTLLAPGETFSFIETIGPIDESDGFVQGYSIVGGRTVLNVGGGVCQVSTTVFRAAFFAGLPITERHEHAFRVGYYEQGSILGLDATIYTGTGTDLRFANDTKGHLLMQLEVYTTTGELYVYLYGTAPEREVVLDGPYLSNWTPAPSEPVYVYNPDLPEGTVRQTDYARDGVDATVYRHIKVNGEAVSTDTFYSHYQAWPNVYEVGTKP